MYVQFGGFTDCPEGWVNFEPSIHLRAQRWPIIGSAFRAMTPHRFDDSIHVGDVLNGLPINDGAAKVVFSSHVLEHLSYEDTYAALRECFRILEPGGLFRCVLPDFEGRARYYIENQDAHPEPAAWLLNSSLLGERKRVRSPIKRMALSLMSTSDHKWMWDFRSLSHALTECGFTSPRRVTYGDNDDAMFAGVEKRERFFWSPAKHTSGEDRLELPELAIEAIKPEGP
jgi:predicted SAM-dependent methyltransferase